MLMSKIYRFGLLLALGSSPRDVGLIVLVISNPRVLSVIIAELNPIDIQLDLLDFT